MKLYPTELHRMMLRKTTRRHLHHLGEERIPCLKNITNPIFCTALHHIVVHRGPGAPPGGIFVTQVGILVSYEGTRYLSLSLFCKTPHHIVVHRGPGAPQPRRYLCHTGQERTIIVVFECVMKGQYIYIYIYIYYVKLFTT